MIPYEGVAEQVIALEVDAASEPAVEAGTMVALSGNGKVKACPASTAPIGVVQRVENGTAAVQVAGYMRLPTPTWRWGMLCWLWIPMGRWRQAPDGAVSLWMWTLTPKFAALFFN